MTLSSSEAAGPDPRPLHARIAADLRDEIMNGDLAPGSKLPSTSQLKSRFDASNATIQKAVRLLKDEGLALGRAGAAVTVRDTRQRTVRPSGSLTPAVDGASYPWLTEASEPARAAHSTLLAVEEVSVVGDVAAALGLPEGSAAVCRRQLITIEGEPAELVSSYYPPDLARGTALAEPRRIRGGTPTLLTELGFPPRHSMDRLSARVATQEQYTALRLPGDLPVLRTLRAVYGAEGQPIEVTVMVKAGHLYELQYEFAPEA
ncbi:GntR family transcriptional regulator [Streptomyces sp. NBC_00335]|uniref:GntR family transcriptional regulator n=1 Tax=unclassified Streptomyces TaxID=2593676 RepID=UPI002256C67B|nr:MULTISPECIES: GntR family transcriptional regulator [unclassified Streptomyces]MCX5407912.1 GntR family transcriptional regulator [Streptomyces sp. NBC_00086]